jgi:hypothetical protein
MLDESQVQVWRRVEGALARAFRNWLVVVVISVVALLLLSADTVRNWLHWQDSVTLIVVMVLLADIAGFASYRCLRAKKLLALSRDLENSEPTPQEIFEQSVRIWRDSADGVFSRAQHRELDELFDQVEHIFRQVRQNPK